MDDLLKDAIADAKAVRETALANAKIALEEAFTPRLKSMLSNKIQSELSEDDFDGEEEAPEEDEFSEEEVPAEDEFGGEDEVDIAVEPEEGEAVEGEFGDEEVPEESFNEEDVIEINGVRYAPIVSEEEGEDEEGEYVEEGDEEEDELDLETILRELEDETEEETNESSKDPLAPPQEDAVVDVNEGDLDTASDDNDSDLDSSDIGNSDNKEPSGEASDSSNIGQGSEEPSDSSDSAEGSEDDNNEVVDDLVEGDEDDEDNIDLEEVLKALSEDDSEEDEVEEGKSAKELAKTKSDLGEHRKVVKYLRSKLNEVNLLNAKLLFSNKLFRSFGLTNEQKMGVVETFDRAKNLREVKLLYTTLAEGFGSSKKPITTNNVTLESKGKSSKPVASTKPKKKEVIGEGFEQKDRFKKLANIL